MTNQAMNVLAEPNRLAIFELLSGGPKAVGELAHELPISRPAVSQHLKALKEAGLVVDRQEGTRRIYRIDPQGVLALRNYLDRLWGNALLDFQLEAEATEEDE